MKQFTLDGRLVPVGPHREDIVVCSDGTECERQNAYFDVSGCPHSNDDDRMEGNVEVVRDILKGVEEWSDQYHTENEDSAEAYYPIVCELHHEWNNIVEDWIRDNLGDMCGHTDHDDYMEDLVESVCNDLYDIPMFEPEYSYSEYAAYSGEGCCLFSAEVGECEEQIDVSNFEELQALHENGELDDCLDELDREFCIHRARRREKDKITGKYRLTGRKTYSRCRFGATFEMYTLPGGQWHFVVPREYMDELIEDFLDSRN